MKRLDITQPRKKVTSNSPRCNWTSFTSKVLDLRWRASWQAAVTTLSIKSSAICSSIWKETDTLKTNHCVQWKETIHRNPSYYFSCSHHLSCSQTFNRITFPNDGCGRRFGQLESNKNKMQAVFISPQTFHCFFWPPKNMQIWFKTAIKTTDRPPQRPHPAAHWDRFLSPDPAASSYWAPGEKAGVSIQSVNNGRSAYIVFLFFI